ncbi:MAG: RelA/SpoT domain-containing protein [Sphingomonas sp.]|nr:RelA/SpoT domain-containing protein [Sphingomonas sp.]
MFEAWGDAVVASIVEGLNGNLSPISADIFLRIPPKARLKADVSIVEKAFYRKNYDDPYNQITDKVGVRFVVLLNSDLKMIEKIIEECDLWTASKDRDFEDEQKQNPIQFDYAAVHYVVYCKGNRVIGGTDVRDGTPCEVQVKTILQHAYSELTHDTIYKPRVDATPAMKRTAAKSMALIEATNDYFEDITKQVSAVTLPERATTAALTPLYQQAVGKEPQTSRLEGLLLDAFQIDDYEHFTSEVANTLAQSAYIGTSIAQRAKTKLLFRQPSILAAYYLAQNQGADLKALWPLTEDELRPIFVDLGLSFDGQ